MPNLANLVHTCIFHHSEMMKSWHTSLPSFNPFVIVFYFLFRRLAKRDAPAPYAYPNDYHVAAAYPGPAPVAKIFEYVQLFSWSVVASILNCFYIISVKKLNRKVPSRAIFTRLWTLQSEKKFTKISLCLSRLVAKAWNYFSMHNWWLNTKPCKFSTHLRILPQWNDEKLTSLSPFLQPFCNCLLFFI